MQNILVLGFGVASTAYISLLDHNKKRVFVVGSPFDFKKIKSAKKLRYIKYDNIKLNFSKNIFFYNNLEDIPFLKFSLIIIGVNSNGIAWAASELKKIKKNCPILILTKGLKKEKKTICTISDYFKTNTSYKKIISASGPCLAGELMKKIHTRTVLASSNINDAKIVKKILENQYYHPALTTDIKGAEICAATKNIYATIIGAAAGQSGLNIKRSDSVYFNAASALFEQSLKEMNIIVKKFHGNTLTVMGPAGAGDLYVSALGGRNSKMGHFLGNGFLYKKIISNFMKGITVEGAELILDVGSQLIRILGAKNIPLATFLYDAVKKNKKLRINWKKFIN
jgi:glycerol-3-phosphate dehydrogenase (NAD(P)+)